MGRLNGVSSPYTVEILYQLGTHQDAGTQRRLHALLQWLADSARSHVHNVHPPGYNRPRMGLFSPDNPPAIASPASEHVHCVAAILWFSHEANVQYDLLSLLSQDLIRYCLLVYFVLYVFWAQFGILPFFFRNLIFARKGLGFELVLLQSNP